MATRSLAVTAAVAAGAALVAGGITYASAASEPAAQAAPVSQAVAAAPEGGNNNNNNENDRNRNRDRDEDEDFNFHRIGRVHINERTFPAVPDGCIVVVSGLGADSFNIRNDSKRTIEFFRGATCDNGAPIATVGPFSTANDVVPRHVKGGVKVKHGVVGSFRVVREHIFREHEEHEEHENVGK